MLASEEAQSAAERVAGDTDVRRRAGKRRQPVLGRGLDDLAPERSAVDTREPRVGVDTNAAHPPGPKQQRAGERADARTAVPRPLNRDPQPVLPSVLDRADHVARRLGQHNRLRMLVDRQIPRAPGFVPLGRVRAQNARRASNLDAGHRPLLLYALSLPGRRPRQSCSILEPSATGAQPGERRRSCFLPDPRCVSSPSPLPIADQYGRLLRYVVRIDGGRERQHPPRRCRCSCAPLLPGPQRTIRRGAKHKERSDELLRGRGRLGQRHANPLLALSSRPQKQVQHDSDADRRRVNGVHNRLTDVALPWVL